MKKFFGKMKVAFKKAMGTAKRVAMGVLAALFGCLPVCAQDVTSGIGAIEKVSGEIAQYIGPIQTLLYSIAGIVALVGAISVYIKMNNEEQDVKKSIMLVIGACIFLIAAAEALPLFFGL